MADPRHVDASMRLFATELMPEIRSWGNGPAGGDGFLSAR
jgi:hypothetical protein